MANDSGGKKLTDENWFSSFAQKKVGINLTWPRSKTYLYPFCGYFNCFVLFIAFFNHHLQAEIPLRRFIGETSTLQLFESCFHFSIGNLAKKNSQFRIAVRYLGDVLCKSMCYTNFTILSEYCMKENTSNRHLAFRILCSYLTARIEFQTISKFNESLVTFGPVYYSGMKL